MAEPDMTAGDALRDLIDRGPMTRFQCIAIGICVLLNMLDGFDVLVMAFTGPALSADWKLSGTALGVLLSAGLFGMAGGSLLIAPWADRFGRRPLIVLGLALISTGMLASALTESVGQLAGTRILTGLGIGTILASVTVITSEYASTRWRSAAIAIMTTGYTVGATLGGFIAAVLIAHFGWRSAFVFGGVLSLLMLPIVLARLPESLDFILARRPPRALEKLNRLLRLMQHPALEALPHDMHREAHSGATVKQLVSQHHLRGTICIWTAFFLLMAAFYFVMSWTPKLLVESGLSATQGVTGGILLNVGGIVGGILFGVLASRFGLKLVTAIYFVAGAMSVASFGLFASELLSSLLIAVLIGALITGAVAGLYSIAPSLYPPTIRTTGMGWAIGIGRIGAIVAPLLAGSLLDQGWRPAELYYLFSVPLLLALAAVLVIKLRQA